MDPFVVIKAGDQKFKTKVKDGAGKEPKWDEAFDIDLEAAGEKIKIKVKDEDVGSSDKVGEGYIDVAELTAAGGFDQWVEIEHKGKSAGTVHIVV